MSKSEGWIEAPEFSRQSEVKDEPINDGWVEARTSSKDVVSSLTTPETPSLTIPEIPWEMGDQLENLNTITFFSKEIREQTGWIIAQLNVIISDLNHPESINQEYIDKVNNAAESIHKWIKKGGVIQKLYNNAGEEQDNIIKFGGHLKEVWSALKSLSDQLERYLQNEDDSSLDIFPLGDGEDEGHLPPSINRENKLNDIEERVEVERLISFYGKLLHQVREEAWKVILEAERLAADAQTLTGVRSLISRLNGVTNTVDGSLKVLRAFEARLSGDKSPLINGESKVLIDQITLPTREELEDINSRVAGLITDLTTRESEIFNKQVEEKIGQFLKSVASEERDEILTELLNLVFDSESDSSIPSPDATRQQTTEQRSIFDKLGLRKEGENKRVRQSHTRGVLGRLLNRAFQQGAKDITTLVNDYRRWRKMEPIPVKALFNTPAERIAERSVFKEFLKTVQEELGSSFGFTISERFAITYNHLLNRPENVKIVKEDHREKMATMLFLADQEGLISISTLEIQKMLGLTHFQVEDRLTKANVIRSKVIEGDWAAQPDKQAAFRKFLENSRLDVLVNKLKAAMPVDASADDGSDKAPAASEPAKKTRKNRKLAEETPSASSREVEAEPADTTAEAETADEDIDPLDDIRIL